MALAQTYATPGSPYEPTFDTSAWSMPISPNPTYGCSTPVTPLPLPQNPPTAEDWANYKDTILEMYDTLNLPLPTVLERMREQYGFIATVKMYKDRFSPRNWNIRKHLKDQDVEAYRESVAQGKPLKFILNRPIREHIMKRRLKDQDKKSPNKVRKPNGTSKPTAIPRRRTESISSVTSVSTDDVLPESCLPMLKTPHTDSALTMYSGCKAFVMLENYLEARLFNVEHMQHFFGPIEMFPPEQQLSTQPTFLHPSHLNMNYARGMALLRDRRSQLAGYFLSAASGALEDLVVVHHPSFPSCLLDAFIELKLPNSLGMRDHVTYVALKTAMDTLGPRHAITALCHFVQSNASDDEQVEQLLWFGGKFCQLFSRRLGKQHPIAAYINLKHFEKLLQLKRFGEADTQFRNQVEPFFITMVSTGNIPKTMRAACLCYLRRKAHLLSSVNDKGGAERALSRCVHFAMAWLAERKISVAGNPLMEECFRLIDEIADFLFRKGLKMKGIDLHSFAIGISAAVRGECEGKTVRMFSAQLGRYADAGFADRVRILCVRFPTCSTIVNDSETPEDSDEEVLKPSDHILRCPTCANGPDTQLWCEQHRTQEYVTPQDRVFVRHTRECLEDLLKWFGMSTE